MADAFGKSLSRQISDLSRIHRNRAASLLADIGLHPGQEKVLKALVSEDGRTMGDLAGTLGVQAPTVTKMIARLAVVGLLERRQGEGDGRQARVYLTVQGRERAERIDRIWKTLDRQTFAGFDPKDKKRLKKLLKRMRDNLEATSPLELALPERPTPVEDFPPVDLIGLETLTPQEA